MFKFLQHLFTVRALEIELKQKELELQESELRNKELETQLAQSKEQCKKLNEALHEKIPPAGVSIDPPPKYTLMGRRIPSQETHSK